MEADVGDMSKKSQSGGVNIRGTVGNVGGSIVGGDMSNATSVPSADLEAALRPLFASVESTPAETRAEAEAKLVALKHEAAKGKDANDGVVAKLIDGFVGLVPAGIGAVVSAFATPVLGAVAGPVTKFVLDKIQGK